MAAVPRGDARLLRLLRPAAPHWCKQFAHPWTEQKAPFNVEPRYLRAEGNSCKTGVSKAVFSQKLLIFQCTTMPVTIARQGHVICIATVINCPGNISRREENIPLRPKNQRPPYPCHLARAVKVTRILGLQRHQVPVPTSHLGVARRNPRCSAAGSSLSATSPASKKDEEAPK